MDGKGATAKLIVLHPFALYKHSVFTADHHRLWLLFVLSFFSLALAFIHLSSMASPLPSNFSAGATPPPSLASSRVGLASSSPSNGLDRPHMSYAEISAVSSAIHRCSPCNVLVFGIPYESMRWKTLNFNGRTVFVDENEYAVSKFENDNAGVEAYDIKYTTVVGEMKRLLLQAKASVFDECRPVQNLLFSDCVLAVNDLPNHLYDLAWDVIIVDGPRGYSANSPGRMSVIFSAAVMARTKGKGARVFVHEVERETERLYSDEFLCRRNLVEVVGSLGHFLVRSENNDSSRFCEVSR